MLAEQAFLWWNYYIIHLHQLSQGISQCNWPANQIQIVMRAGGGKRSFPSMQIHNQIKFSSVKRKLLIAIFQLSNFLRHSCSNSRKISPSLPFNKLKETGHTVRIRIRGRTRRNMKRKPSAPLWIEIPEIINGIIWRLCVENSMKIAQKRNTDWRVAKKGNKKQNKERDREKTLLN